MFFELSYLAIRLWLEDQTDKGGFQSRVICKGRGNFLDVSIQFGGVCSYSDRRSGQGWSIAVATSEAVFNLSLRENWHIYQL